MLSNRQVGEWRDARLEMERLLRTGSKGPILETAVQEGVTVHADFFRNDGPDLKHCVSGQTIEDFVSTLRTTKPHWFADFAPETEEQALQSLIEDACLEPTPSKLGKLYKQVGEMRYNEILSAWGVDAKRMKAGHRPGYSEEPEQKKIAAQKTNPWSAAGWSISKQGALIKSIGIEKASGIAKSVGCFIGSTKPNPKYN